MDIFDQIRGHYACSRRRPKSWQGRPDGSHGLLHWQYSGLPLSQIRAQRGQEERNTVSGLSGWRLGSFWSTYRWSLVFVGRSQLLLPFEDIMAIIFLRSCGCLCPPIHQSIWQRAFSSVLCGIQPTLDLL